MPSDPIKKLRVKSLPGRPNHKAPASRRLRGRHIVIFLLAVAIGFGAYRKGYLPWKMKTLAKAVYVVTAAAPSLESAAPVLPHPPAPPPPQNTEKFEIRHQTIKSGDTLAGILKASGISESFAEQWENACKSATLRIKEDDEIIFFLNRDDGQPAKVIYSLSDGASFTLRRASEAWECHYLDSVPRGPIRAVHGRYSENFYDSCVAGGLPAVLIPNLADIFAYDVDFTTDFKDGDTFSVYFQEQPIAAGEGKQFLIVAAEMNISGKTFQAFGFQLPDGSWEYFDQRGVSLKRAFLRSPINYRRLISPSTYKNIKPVLKIYRPHLGIDYAAPRGTPVSAIGDGVVSNIRKSGKFGLVIEVRHRGGYRSFYGNLSGLSRGLKRGSLVLQGEVIGSVGSAGNGKEYLDFHFYKDGKPVNFQTAELARMKSIPKNILPEFEKSRDSYSAALQGKISDGQKQEILSGRD